MGLKILIIRFSSIGDLVLITPVIRCLKLQRACEIHLITKSKFQSVLQHNPYISKHWSFKKELSEVSSQLKAEKFDLVIDLHKNLRSLSLIVRLNKPSYSFNKINFWKWLMCKFKMNYLPDKHLVDRYFEGLKSLNLKNDGNGLDYFFSPDFIHDSDQTVRPEKYLVGVLGAAHFTKQIPHSKWREIIVRLQHPLVLIGGENEMELGNELANEFPDVIINQVGLLNIEGSAGWIKNALMVITPDTGMMHIAAALKKPMHVAWGNTIPQFGMYPYFGTEPVFVKNHELQELNCRPCSKLGYSKCPKTHFKCMMDQNFSNQNFTI